MIPYPYNVMTLTLNIDPALVVEACDIVNMAVRHEPFFYNFSPLELLGCAVLRALQEADGGTYGPARNSEPGPARQSDAPA